MRGRELEDAIHHAHMKLAATSTRRGLNARVRGWHETSAIAWLARGVLRHVLSHRIPIPIVVQRTTLHATESRESHVDDAAPARGRDWGPGGGARVQSTGPNRVVRRAHFLKEYFTPPHTRPKLVVKARG